MADTAAHGTVARKADHIRVNLEQNVAGKTSSGFDRYAFVNCALPEIDLAEVDTTLQLFGRKLGAPILISCMTGGTEEAQRINQTLAAVAQEFRFAMGLGSARALLEHPELLPTFDVRATAPDTLLFANLGAVQLNKGYGAADCRTLLELLHADALVLHLNALQEAVQPNGDTNFSGLLEKIARVCNALDQPVIVKEVGWGIGPDAVADLFEAGVAAVDLAGAGGTSWSEVERHRIAEPWRARVAAAFGSWGIPTAACLKAARAAEPHGILIASGGIRNGMDVVKAIALGANLAGIAGPFLRAAAEGAEATRELAREYAEVLRIAMFALGARTLNDLRGTRRLVEEGRPL